MPDNYTLIYWEDGTTSYVHSAQIIEGGWLEVKHYPEGNEIVKYPPRKIEKIETNRQ